MQAACSDIEEIARMLSDNASSRSFDDEEVPQIRGRMLEWYHRCRRKLPWRGDAIDGVCEAPQMTAYGTWVSEIMCQQTRVDTVIPYWLRWMEAIPNVKALAAASTEQINSLWSGLGYYRRARMLQLGAQYVCEHHDGDLPLDVEALLKIPGIGPYTAGAIASVAGNVRAPLVDGNVIRVLSRLRAITHDLKSTKMQKLCWELADALVDPAQPGSFNQAMMELGATVCKPTNPACEFCPVSTYCYARRLVDHAAQLDGTVEVPRDVTHFPIKTPKKGPRQEIYRVHVIERRIHDIPKYLFIKRPENGLLAGQWELPSCLLWPLEPGMTPDEDSPAALPEIQSLNEAELVIHFFRSLKLDFHDSLVEPESFQQIVHRISVAYHDDVIEHIFSHVKHHMYVAHHTISEEMVVPESWESSEGRQVRWMTMDELAQVGITTGVKKVLQAVQRVGKTKTKRKSSVSATTKARTAASESASDKKQRTLKDFF